MKFAKYLISALGVIAFVGAIELWWNTFIMGQLYANASIMTTLVVTLFPITFGYIIYRMIRFVNSSRFDKMLGLVAVAILGIGVTGCSYASANVQTLISNDCGVTWELINPGQVVPARNFACEYKVTVPDYPLQGDYRFKASFANRVLAEIEVSYDYSITEAKTFIGEAKYLGKPNSDSDDASNGASPYESAENAVIDRRIREVAANLLLKEDIVDFSQAEFEDRLMVAVNEMLKTRGVQLNTIAFVPTPEEQTRLAIDMMTAMKVYESKGLGELGQKVAVARASATKIEVGKESTTPTQK
jgi:hypothetical protein